MDSVVADPIEHLHVDGFHYDRRYVQPLTTSLSSALVALASRWGAPTPRACLVPGAGRQVVEVAAEEFDDLALAGLYPSVGAATGVENVLMILLMLTSGAFTPTSVLPDGVRRVFEFSPVRWFVDLTQPLWDAGTVTMRPLLLLTALLVAAALMGRLLFRWETAR